MTSDTAILVFARSAAAESQYKRFCADSLRNEAVWATLSQRTLRLARATGYPVYHYTEQEQSGGDFGQRISNATAEVLARGYERLIILGGDCPTLTVGLLQQAANRLQQGQTVLGPDRRGGAYLIGLQRRDFYADRFAELPWQTPRILAALRVQLGVAVLLTPQRDLNYRADLLRMSGLASRHSLLARLFLLLFAPPRPALATEVFVRPGPVGRQLADRGPPRPVSACA
jgi:hypothetical protein